MYDFPDFVIAGSAKSGTTALYRMLDQHPAVYMSAVKETNFFVHAFEPTQHYVDLRGCPVLAPERGEVIDSVEKYRATFDGARADQQLGEASPWYLINPHTPARIRRHRAQTRIVLILRNPADVAFANFMHHVRVGSETLSADEIEQALDSRRYRRDELYPFCRHLEIPRYAAHLPVWLDAFDRSQLHLMVYEEFRARRRAALSDLFAFLGLSDAVAIDVDRRVNVTGLPRSVAAQNLIQGNNALKKLIARILPTKPRRRARALLEALNTNPKVEMPSAVRAHLDGLYEADVAYVESVLGRKIDGWHTQPMRDVAGGRRLDHAARRGVRRNAE